MLERFSSSVKHVLAYVKKIAIQDIDNKDNKDNTPLISKSEQELLHNRTGILILNKTIEDCVVVSEDIELSNNIINRLLFDSASQMDNIMFIYNLVDPSNEKNMKTILKPANSVYKIPTPKVIIHKKKPISKLFATPPKIPNKSYGLDR